MPSEDEKAAKARDAALQGALSQIERQFGKGTVMRMGDEGAQVRVHAIPTGALSLDLALGIGLRPLCRRVVGSPVFRRDRTERTVRAFVSRLYARLQRECEKRPAKPCRAGASAQRCRSTQCATLTSRNSS